MVRQSEPETTGPDPRFLPRDTRRESWVNPNPNDPDILPFDIKVAKISTEEDLKAWIASQGHKDLARFIQYAAKQHDDNTETHNMLVGMVDDANAAIQELEDIIAERTETIKKLQRESQTPEPRPIETRKSTKIPDPPIFEGKEQDVENWLSRMRNKLQANLDHYLTDHLQITYAESRIGGDAAKHIAPRMRATALNRFETAEEIFDLLYQVYGDPDRRHTAQREYSKLYQGRKPFSEFWAEFQRLAAELEYNQTSLIDDLRHKLNPNLQTALINAPDPIDLYSFAKDCQRVDQRLRDIDQVKERFERRITTRTNPTASRNVVPNGPSSTRTSATLDRQERPPRRPQNPDPAKEELIRTGACFTCKKPGHRAIDCPDKTIHELDIEETGNDNPLPKTR